MRSTVRVGGGRSPLALIWLNNVKRTVLLFSERFHFFQLRVAAAWLSQRQERFVFLRLFNAEMRESTRRPLARPSEVINRSRSDAAFIRSLGTRVGLGTASNDHRESRLTGSLPLVHPSLAGVVVIGVFLCFF
jgi:hypothetical protein